MRERWSDVERMWFGMMVVVVEMNIPDSWAVRDGWLVINDDLLIVPTHISTIFRVLTCNRLLLINV